jgi:hypothetical protein
MILATANGPGPKPTGGDADCSAAVSQAGTDCMLTRNRGLGLSSRDTRTGADVTRSAFNGKLAWTSNAVLACATMKF